jgi:hypothetical protein
VDGAHARAEAPVLPQRLQPRPKGVGGLKGEA